MAYMNQEKKQAIKLELKKVIPTDWKWSLSVENYSTIVLTIKSGPAELLPVNYKHYNGNGYHRLNEYYVESVYGSDSELTRIWTAIVKALNLNNHDNSDIMTDYFDVGHYISIQIGKWDKPFIAK